MVPWPDLNPDTDVAQKFGRRLLIRTFFFFAEYESGHQCPVRGDGLHAQCQGSWRRPYQGRRPATSVTVIGPAAALAGSDFFLIFLSSTNPSPGRSESECSTSTITSSRVLRSQALDAAVPL